MDGITDAPFRWITDIYGKPDIVYTEFVSVKGLILGKPAIQRMLLHHQTKTFTVAQFFGCEPEYFYQAAQFALEKGFDGVDINMGCPDKSVFNRGGGAGLILQPKLAKKIILSVKKAVKDGTKRFEIKKNITVSVKTRTGYRTPQTKEWISNLLEAEPDVICIHARTFAQKYSGLADWSQIKIAADLAKSTKTKIFGNGDIICFDFKGTRIWAKNLGVPNNHYGHSSSLILYSQRLIVQYDHNKARNIIGLDTKDGEVRWNTTRPGKISWSSPSMIKKGSSYQVVVNNEPFVAAYNPENGKELWKIECLSGEIGPSPAYANGIIFAVNEYAKLAAIQLENSPKILWENNDFLSEVASPVAMGEYLIVPTSSGEVACYNTKDGTIFWQHEFDIGFYSSPIIADGKIYLINRDGVMHIMKLDKIFNLISEPKLGEKTDCTPAFAKERIYISGQNNLYCIK